MFNKGLLTGLVLNSGVVIKKYPQPQLRDAFAQNLPELEKKKKFILVNGEQLTNVIKM